MAVAQFRFYEELNEFLAPQRREQAFAYSCARAATVKHAIEALGVPHTEVELIMVNAEPVGFGCMVHEGDRISVYPRREALATPPLFRLHDRPVHGNRFIADAHLGGLARLLRMLGFDTLYRNDFDDAQIVRIARAEERIILTRDRDLLKHKAVACGCYVHALRPRAQLVEIVERLDLVPGFDPFSRCLHCNHQLQPVDRAVIFHRLPPQVAATYTRFSICTSCDKVYWEGSHWSAMRATLDRLLDSPLEDA